MRGGKRAGAGRKPGSVTTRTKLLAEAVASRGITPLDYLMGIVRDGSLSRDERMDAAKAAAPYIHPRLSAVEVDGSFSVTPYDDMSDDDLAANLSAYAAQLAHRGKQDRGRTGEEGAKARVPAKPH